MAIKKQILDDKLHWYKDAIIYELHIKAFRDGNNDGIGDFEGLLEKLDYLEDLGVTAVWVLPFYPSPLKDDGYDIADYYSINSSYGNIRQFKIFLKEAHKRNLKVITELVINHTSDQHPWFQRARRAPKGSKERDFYVWTDDPTQYKDVRIIFQDFESSNWTWDSVAQQYYWHRFFHHQPDLNYDNPLVQQEVFKIIDYWCKMGVDGFRLDAVPYLFERENTNGENLPETHAYLKKLRKHVDESFPGTLLLAEANMWPEDSASYFGNGDECHMNYHFPIMPRMFMALQMEDRYPITDIFDQTPEIPETCQWAIFLRNHDELTLEMVTDEERDYMYKVYAKDPKAKINLGIRHRLSPLMENNRRKIELMNYLLFSLRGTPVIYYGDEIGMGDNFYLGDRDGVRTPMQWSPDRNAGFSEANPQKLYLPVILDPEYHYESVNVETQYRNASSLLWFMMRIINMRKKYQAFSRGDMKFINVENPKVLAFTRSYKNETILVVVNLSRFLQAAELDLSEHKRYVPVEIFSKNKFPPIKETSNYFFTLSPYACYWFSLERTDAQHHDDELLNTLEIRDWKYLLQNQSLSELENNILPEYIVKTKWFSGRQKTIQSIRITDHVALPLTEKSVYILLLEVQYESGLPEAYQLPVAFASAKTARKISDIFPQAVLTKLKIGEEEGILCDALYLTEVQQMLINRMANNQDIDFKESEIDFEGSRELRKHLNEHADSKAKILSEQPGFTIINYDNCFNLKIYRKVDRAVNPDEEIVRFLSKQAKLAHVPALTGAIKWRYDRDYITLGILQLMCQHHGDGFTNMLERLHEFTEAILSHEKEGLPAFEFKGSLTDPAAFDAIPEKLKTLLGASVAEQAKLLGIRTGEMHLALASATDFKDFKPENFSLHYQRSLYSSMQSLVRSSYQSLSRNIKKISEDEKAMAEEILAKKEVVLRTFKRIYAKKLDVTKTRIHGNYHLAQVLFTGKDIVVSDFGGDASRSYSERRLKWSPLRDVAVMMRSFHYVAYEGLYLNNEIRKEDINKLKPFVELWYHYVSGFFVNAYVQTVQGSAFIPKEKEDLLMMLQTYILERAFIELNHELINRPELAVVPLRAIKYIINR